MDDPPANRREKLTVIWKSDLRKLPVVRSGMAMKNPDGSFTIRAIEGADGWEISTRDAARILGFRDRESIHHLCQLGAAKGGVAARKKETPRGNSPWRISLQSVLDYKASRIKAARE